MISRDTYIELTKFGIVGGLCFGLDLAIYYGLTASGLDTWMAKSLSVVSATFLNYYLNKTWTWGHSHKDNKRFRNYLILYGVSGALNVISNSFFLKILPDHEFSMVILNKSGEVLRNFLTIKLDKFLAVIGATIVGMIVNFIGQKLWVFKTPEGLENPSPVPGE